MRKVIESARYAKGSDDESCGFTTFDQCMADVSGIGGYCARNTHCNAGSSHGL